MQILVASYRPRDRTKGLPTPNVDFSFQMRNCAWLLDRFLSRGSGVFPATIRLANARQCAEDIPQLRLSARRRQNTSVARTARTCSAAHCLLAGTDQGNQASGTHPGNRVRASSSSPDDRRERERRKGDVPGDQVHEEPTGLRCWRPRTVSAGANAHSQAYL